MRAQRTKNIMHNTILFLIIHVIKKYINNPKIKEFYGYELMHYYFHVFKVVASITGINSNVD